MAGNIEEIAALIKSIKLDNELNNEDMIRSLNEIRNKVSDLHDYNENADMISAIQQILDSKTVVDIEKIDEFDRALKDLKSRVDSSADIAELSEQVQTLADNFRSGFNSVVSFANKDADAKNLLLDRMTSLETSVKNGEVIESLRHRTDELVKGYENFVSDSNLRHGNMVSTIVDLKNKIDEYSSKNNYTIGTIDHSISDTYTKITNLESTVSSHLGNVNSRLYSMGDDIQKILNDGFDHLKYLSSNISEAMNSSSLDVKTTLEVLKSNIAGFADHFKEEVAALNTDISNQIINNGDTNRLVGNDIINSVKELENVLVEKSSNCETLFNDKVNNVLEFITALQEAVSVLVNGNNTQLLDRLSELRGQVQEFNSEYERLLVSAAEEIRNVSGEVAKTSDEIVARLQQTGFGEIENVKQELLSTSSSNFNAIIERVQEVSNSVDNYRTTTADNLSSYLTTIRDLFTDFSAKVESSQDNTELFEKLSNLENLMNKIDSEKNENFVQIQVMLSKNADTIQELLDLIKNSENFESLENLINQNSLSKDEKLSNIESLMNRINSEKEEHFARLQELLNKNAAAIDALNVRAGTSLGLEKIENLIKEQGEIKDEKLYNLESLISGINAEKNENFVQMLNLLNQNANAIEILMNTDKTSQNFETLQNLITGQEESNSVKLDNIEVLLSRIDIERNERFAQIQEILNKNSEALAVLENYGGNSQYFESLENLIKELDSSKETKLANLEDLMGKIDAEKNEGFDYLRELLNNNAEMIANLEAESAKSQNLEALANLVRESSSFKDEKLVNIENLAYKIDSEKNANFEKLQELLNKNAEAISVLNNNPEIVRNLEKLDNIEVLLSRIDIEKNENFAQLKEQLTRNIEAIEVLMGVVDNTQNFESLENLINEHDTFKRDKLLRLEELVSKIDTEKNENFARLQELLTRNSEVIEALKYAPEFTRGLEKLESIEGLVNKVDTEKNENFVQLQEILNKNTESLETLINLANNTQNIDYLEGVINELYSSKDERFNNLEAILNNLSSEKNESFEDLKELLINNIKTIELMNVNSETLSSIENLSGLINEHNIVKDLKLESLKNLVDEYKESVSKLSEDLSSQVDKNYSEISELKVFASEILPKRADINDLSTLIDSKVVECKSSISEEIENVKDSLTTINEGVSSILPLLNDSSITLRLNELNTQLTESSQNYEQSLAILSTRLGEYAEASDQIAAIAKSQLETSSNKFDEIQSRFENLSEQINTLVGNSGLIEILANIRQQFNIIAEQIDNEKNGIVEKFQTSITENAENLCSNLVSLRSYLEEEQHNQSVNLEKAILDIETIKINVTDILAQIESSVNEKLERLISEFKPFETAIKDFISLNFASAINEIKHNIELSYVNLKTELSEDINENELFTNIEEAYKTSVDKLASIEDVIRYTIEDNINSINNTLFNVHNIADSNFSLLEELQASFQTDLVGLENSIKENKNAIVTTVLDEITELKGLINNNQNLDAQQLREMLLPLLENEELLTLIKGLNKTLADKITEFKQDSELASQDILDVINSTGNTVDYILDLINEKFEKSDNNVAKIIENFDTINAKLDVIVMACNGLETSSELVEINEKLENFKETFSDSLAANNEDIKLLAEKIDIIAAAQDDESLYVDLEEIKNNLQDVIHNSAEAMKFGELINLISNKLDIIVSNDNSELLEDNFNEIQEIINDSVGTISSKLEQYSNVGELVKIIDSKLDVIAQSDASNLLEEIETIKEVIFVLKNDLTSTETKLENYLRAMDSTLDVLTSAHEDNIRISNNMEDLKENLSIFNANIHDIEKKLDVLATVDNSEILEETDEIKSIVKSMDNKLDIVAQNSNEDVLSEIDGLKDSIDSSVEKLSSISEKTDDNIKRSFEELKEQISNTESTLEDYSRTLDCKLDEISQFTSVHEKLETIKSDVQENLKMEELINQLNNKVDILAMSDDSDVVDEIYSIKQLVEDQLESLQSSVADTKHVQKLMTALNKIDENITEIDFSKQASEIKEAVISAVVSVTNEISFVEEADEIKDFVDEKTNELHRLLMDVKHQLYTITNTADDMDMYSYTLQDVESDIAKLRLVVNDFAGKNGMNELAVISTNLNKMSKAMDDLRNAVIEVEIQRAAKSDIPDINEQVVSISSRLNKFMLSRRDVDTQIIEKLDTNFAAVAELSSRNHSGNVEQLMFEADKKLENMSGVLTILKNVMMYLGEWMDGTTETLTSIYDRTDFNEELNELKQMIPQKSEFINLIEKKFKQQEADIENLQNIVENTIAQNDLKADELQTILENRIMKQEARLDRIEKTLDRLTSILEASGSNTETMDRIEKMDETITKLNANIEKLAAYVE